MIVPDLNLLLCAYNPGARNHAAARSWWDSLLRGGPTVGLPWAVVLGFVRLSTTRGAFARPVAPAAALRRVVTWLEQPGVSLVNPGPDHLRVLAETLAETAGGALTNDAHLAVLAIEHRAELHSNDGDLARFK